MAAALKSRQERYEQGKALRARVPREAHGDLKGPRKRNAVAILAESDPERVPELVPERYKRMMLDRSRFLRGAAAVMATDLAHQPIAGCRCRPGGDSHLMNFGAFVTPEDNILFDVNDFDETLPGVDFTVDRQASGGERRRRGEGGELVGQAGAQPRGGRRNRLSRAPVRAHGASPREIWHSRIDLQQQLNHIESPELRRSLSTLIRHAQHRGLDRDDNFPHLVTGGEPRIADKPPTISTSTRRRSGAARSTLLEGSRFTARRSLRTGRFYSTATD